MAEHDVEEARQEPKAPGKGKAKAKGLLAFDGFGQTTETAIAVSEDNVRAGVKFSTPHTTAYTRPRCAGFTSRSQSFSCGKGRSQSRLLIGLSTLPI